MIKTNAVRVLEELGIEYELRSSTKSILTICPPRVWQQNSVTSRAAFEDTRGPG